MRFKFEPRAEFIAKDRPLWFGPCLILGNWGVREEVPDSNWRTTDDCLQVIKDVTSPRQARGRS